MCADENKDKYLFVKGNELMFEDEDINFSESSMIISQVRIKPYFSDNFTCTICQ